MEVVRYFQDVPTVRGKSHHLQVENTLSLPLLRTIFLVLIVTRLLIVLSHIIVFWAGRWSLSFSLGLGIKRVLLKEPSALEGVEVTGANHHGGTDRQTGGLGESQESWDWSRSWSCSQVKWCLTSLLLRGKLQQKMGFSTSWSEIDLKAIMCSGRMASAKGRSNTSFLGSFFCVLSCVLSKITCQLFPTISSLTGYSTEIDYLNLPKTGDRGNCMPRKQKWLFYCILLSVL